MKTKNFPLSGVRSALRNWLFCFLAERDGCDPSDDYFEKEWKGLTQSVKGYLSGKYDTKNNTN